MGIMDKQSLYLCAIIAICEFGFGISNDFWCLQCTWDTQTAYSSNTTNAIGNECIMDDLDDITKYPSDSPSPVVNPLCTYDQSGTDYVALLSGPCYDNACYAMGSQVCAKWTEYQNGNIMKIIRMCAIPGGVENGCYHQSYGDGHYKEVCFCENQEFCNSAQNMQLNIISYTTISFSILIPPTVRWFVYV